METKSEKEARLLLADQIRVASDSKLPPLPHLNSQPCTKHSELIHGCRQCGINLRRHQRVGVSWLYVRRKGLLADSVGTGKTIHAAGLLALLASREELHNHSTLIVVRNPTAAAQWVRELNRCLIGVNVELGIGTAIQRRQRYVEHWDVLVVNQSILLNDIERLLTIQERNELHLRTLIIDDVDALRNYKNKTARAIKRFAMRCDRTVIMTGTPLQKKLHEMHSVMEPLGGREVFRSRDAFMREYTREDWITVHIPPKPGHRRTTREVKKVVAYQNLDKFKHLITPFALRRTALDIVDVDLPLIQPVETYVDLTPAQRARYDELQDGVLQIIREQGTEVSWVTAGAKWLHGEQICVGTVAIDNEYREGENSKVERLVNVLAGEDSLDLGELEGEKVVVFSKFKAPIRAACELLSARGIGVEVLWGENRGSDRERAIYRFWEDPGCLVLMGTSAMEQSLNLQVSRHLINLNQIMNPARMEQLAGRIRRDGSPHPMVYVHNWLATDTQEERYMEALMREQALIDHIWDEDSELFESLSPLERMQLITGGH